MIWKCKKELKKLQWDYTSARLHGKISSVLSDIVAIYGDSARATFFEAAARALGDYMLQVRSILAIGILAPSDGDSVYGARQFLGVVSIDSKEENAFPDHDGSGTQRVIKRYAKLEGYIEAFETSLREAFLIFDPSRIWESQVRGPKDSKGR